MTSNVALILLAVGGVSAIAAVLFFFRTRRFLSTAVTVQGTVIDMIQSSGSEGGTVYSPVVQFTTVEGQEITFRDSVASSPPRHTVGETVKVMYPPGNPEGARLPGWFRLWFLPSFSALFAAAFLGAGFFVYSTASDVEEGLAGLPIPGEIASLLPSETPLVPVSPGVLPPAGDAVLVIQQGGGSPQITSVTCDGVRDLKGGRAREVRLSFPGGDLTFKASPYTGPGPYTPGSNLEVGGSLFGSSAGVTGAVVFEKSGQTGVVNLVSGQTSASGAWDCSNVEI